MRFEDARAPTARTQVASESGRTAVLRTLVLECTPAAWSATSAEPRSAASCASSRVRQRTLATGERAALACERLSSRPPSASEDPSFARLFARLPSVPARRGEPRSIARGAPALGGMRPRVLRDEAPFRRRESACARAPHPGDADPARRRAPRFAAFASTLVLDGAAGASRRLGALSTVRSRWLASRSAPRACLHERGESPRGRTLPLA